MFFISPFLRTPLTDLTGCLVNHQTYGRCGEFELNMMECLEAYGIDRGQVKCKDLIDDFTECFTMKTQMLRLAAMRKERFRQIKAGELKEDEKFMPSPRFDAY